MTVSQNSPASLARLRQSLGFVLGNVVYSDFESVGETARSRLEVKLASFLLSAANTPTLLWKYCWNPTKLLPLQVKSRGQRVIRPSDTKCRHYVVGDSVLSPRT
jgi:hypothetical protein